MRIPKLPKTKFSKLISWIAVLLFIGMLIVIPYFDYYSKTKRSSVMGDFNVLGYQISGTVDVDYAVGQQFTFIGNGLNITIPYETSHIHSLQVIKNEEQNSAFFNTEIFNASGKLDIEATNVEYFVYQLVEGSANSLLFSYNQNLSSGLMNSGYPKPSVYMSIDEKQNNLASISTIEKTSHLFVSFASKNGTLSISGDKNFSYSIISGYIGIMLNVSTSINRSHHAYIRGGFREIYLENWDTIKYTVLRDISESGCLSTYSPSGSLSYIDKEFQAKGSQDLDFKNFSGVAYVNPTDDPYFFRVILNANVGSVIAKSGENSLNLTENHLLDPLFPFPLTGVCIALLLIIRRKTREIEYNVIPLVVMLVGALIWSVKTEQPIWIQNFFGYTPLFVTVLTFLIKSRKNHDTSQNGKEKDKPEMTNPKNEKKTRKLKN